jgi:hypothetical protein
MKIKVEGWHTDIYPTDKEIKHETLCNIGGEAEKTCVWLIVAPTGFECVCHHRMAFMVLADRFREGKTTAKKDGCDFVNNLNIPELGMGEHTLNPLEDKLLES